MASKNHSVRLPLQCHYRKTPAFFWNPYCSFCGLNPTVSLCCNCAALSRWLRVFCATLSPAVSPDLWAIFFLLMHPQFLLWCMVYYLDVSWQFSEVWLSPQRSKYRQWLILWQCQYLCSERKCPSLYRESIPFSSTVQHVYSLNYWFDKWGAVG